MSFEQSDLYVSETLRRAASCVPQTSPLYEDVTALSRFFALRHWFARLTMRDAEYVAAYAQELVRRSEKDEFVLRNPLPEDSSL